MHGQHLKKECLKSHLCPTVSPYPIRPQNSAFCLGCSRINHVFFLLEVRRFYLQLSFLSGTLTANMGCSFQAESSMHLPFLKIFNIIFETLIPFLLRHPNPPTYPSFKVTVSFFSCYHMYIHICIKYMFLYITS